MGVTLPALVWQYPQAGAGPGGRLDTVFPAFWLDQVADAYVPVSMTLEICKGLGGLS